MYVDALKKNKSCDEDPRRLPPAVGLFLKRCVESDRSASVSHQKEGGGEEGRREIDWGITKRR